MLDDPKMEWIFDTGAASHLSPERSMLKAYTKVTQGREAASLDPQDLGIHSIDKSGQPDSLSHSHSHSPIFEIPMDNEADEDDDFEDSDITWFRPAKAFRQDLTALQVRVLTNIRFRPPDRSLTYNKSYSSTYADADWA